jgi:hypothetical protein
MKARTWLVGLSSTTLVATVGVVGLGAATVANATTPIEVAAGSVIISTGATDSIVYDADNNASTANVTQALGTSGKCALTPLTGSLVTWGSTSTASGAPGYGSDSIGVSSGNKTSGTACSQINQDAGESLTLRFTGSALAGSFGASLRATSASLDIEVKSNALVVLQGLDAAGAPVTGQVYKLYTGSSTSQNPNGPLAANSTNADRNCTAQSDSGPDSGPNDNCRWDIDFTSPVSGIRITPQVGSTDLEGGGDFAVPSANRTTFAMVDVADGEFCVGSTQTATFSGTGNPLIDSTSVTRLPDTNGNIEGCIPYTLRVDGPSVSFRKPADTPLAQFLITVDRSISPPAANPVPALQIDWINPPEIDSIAWCPADLYNPASNPQFDPTKATDMVPSTTTLEFTCLYSSVQVLQDDGTINVTDKFYLVGDPKYGAF